MTSLVGISCFISTIPNTFLHVLSVIISNDRWPRLDVIVASPGYEPTRNNQCLGFDRWMMDNMFVLLDRNISLVSTLPCIVGSAYFPEGISRSRLEAVQGICMREPVGQVRADLRPWLFASPLIYTNTNHTALPKRSHHDVLNSDLGLENISSMYIHHLMAVDGKYTIIYT